MLIDGRETMDILTLTQRVSNLVSLGESHFREFKTAFEGKPGEKRPRNTTNICRDIGEALVAFANADGGELIIGVEDDGSVTGLQYSNDEIDTMLASPITHVYGGQVLPIKFNQKLTIKSNEILYFSVSKGTDQIYQLPDGRCVKRQDKSTMPIAVDELIFDRNERRSREYDRQFVDNVGTTDLNIEQIEKISNQFIQGMSPEQYLQQLGLAEYVGAGLRLRMAAILLFAKDVSKWHPRSQVRILKISGTKIETGDKYNVTSDDYITGNILELVTMSWQHLRSHLSKKVEFREGAKFSQTYVFPENACREALINAIAHRDYSAQSCTNIHIFEDRLEIENPGELLSTVSLSNLESLNGVHESRNVHIAEILRETSYMRELGEGMRRIFELLEANEFVPPIIRSENGRFSIVFSHKSIYSNVQSTWLDMFKKYELDSDQRKIVVAGLNGTELSQNDIYRALGIQDRNLYDKCVTVLRNKGILDVIRTQAEASRIANKARKSRKVIPRFKVVLPPEREDIQEFEERKVFLYNIPNECDKDTLISMFSVFGKTVDAHIPKDEFGYKNYAFISFEFPSAVQKAIETKKIDIMGSTVSILPCKKFWAGQKNKANRSRHPV